MIICVLPCIFKLVAVSRNKRLISRQLLFEILDQVQLPHCINESDCKQQSIYGSPQMGSVIDIAVTTSIEISGDNKIQHAENITGNPDTRKEDNTYAHFWHENKRGKNE